MPLDTTMAQDTVVVVGVGTIRLRYLKSDGIDLKEHNKYTYVDGHTICSVHCINGQLLSFKSKGLNHTYSAIIPWWESKYVICYGWRKHGSRVYICGDELKTDASDWDIKDRIIQFAQLALSKAVEARVDPAVRHVLSALPLPIRDAIWQATQVGRLF